MLHHVLLEVSDLERSASFYDTMLAPLGWRRHFEEDETIGWGIAKPVVTEDGALVIRPPQGSPFDAFLIWFDNNQAARIVARHVPMSANLSSPAQWAQALTEAWGRELATLGWPRRQDVAANDIVQSLSWHDDRTRMRIFWQESDTPGPPRVFTEWKDLVAAQEQKASR